MIVRIMARAIWRATPETPKPDVSFVPAMERRRLTGVERAALAVAHRVMDETRDVPVVFSSRWGEIGVTAKLMRQFHEDGEMSPAGFSASVHNAAPGAFSLLVKNHASYTAIAARARSLEAGLLEAFAMDGEVVFVHAEEATPDLYRNTFADLQEGCAVALRFVSDGTGDEGEMVHVEFRSADLPPATFDALVDFLEGRSAAFATARFILTRGA